MPASLTLLRAVGGGATGCQTFHRGRGPLAPIKPPLGQGFQKSEPKQDRQTDGRTHRQTDRRHRTHYGTSEVSVDKDLDVVYVWSSTPVWFDPLRLGLLFGFWWWWQWWRFVVRVG